MRNPVEDVQALASMIIKDWGEDHFQNSTKDLLVDMYVRYAAHQSRVGSY